MFYTTEEEELLFTTEEEELLLTSEETELLLTSEETELLLTSEATELLLTSEEKELLLTSEEKELLLTTKEEELLLTSEELLLTGEEFLLTSEELLLTDDQGGRAIHVHGHASSNTFEVWLALMCRFFCKACTLVQALLTPCYIGVPAPHSGAGICSPLVIVVSMKISRNCIHWQMSLVM